jgi:hypothetical protein
MGELMIDATDDATEATEMAEQGVELIRGTTIAVGDTQEGNGQVPERSREQKRQWMRQNLFLEAFVNGKGTIRSASIVAGVSRKVVNDWLNSDTSQGFGQRFEDCQHDHRERVEEEMRAILDDPEHAHKHDILRIFSMKAAWREKYGDQVVITDDTSKRVLDILTLAGRARIDDAPAPKAIEGKHRLLGG